MSTHHHIRSTSLLTTTKRKANEEITSRRHFYRDVTVTNTAGVMYLSEWR